MRCVQWTLKLNKLHRIMNENIHPFFIGKKNASNEAYFWSKFNILLKFWRIIHFNIFKWPLKPYVFVALIVGSRFLHWIWKKIILQNRIPSRILKCWAREMWTETAAWILKKNLQFSVFNDLTIEKGSHLPI